MKERYLPAGGAALQFCSISEGQQRGSACSAAPWLCLEPGASLRELSVVVLLCEAALAAAPAVSQGQPRARSLPLPVPSALGVALRAEGPGSLLLPPAGRDGAGAVRCRCRCSRSARCSLLAPPPPCTCAGPPRRRWPLASAGLPQRPAGSSTAVRMGRGRTWDGMGSDRTGAAGVGTVGAGAVGGSPA